MNMCVGEIFNLDYIVNGRGQLLAESKKDAPSGNEDHRPNILELYTQLIHEVEQLRSELNSQIREVKDVREQLTKEREALHAISMQLTATLMGARSNYPIANHPIQFAADDNQPQQ